MGRSPLLKHNYTMIYIQIKSYKTNAIMRLFHTGKSEIFRIIKDTKLLQSQRYILSGRASQLCASNTCLIRVSQEVGESPRNIIKHHPVEETHYEKHSREKCLFALVDPRASAHSRKQCKFSAVSGNFTRELVLRVSTDVQGTPRPF